MSRRNREKRVEKRANDRGYTPLGKHIQQGSQFVPPLKMIPNLKPSSWRDERLPEVLWAAVLISHMPRDYALELFRRVAMCARELASEGQQLPGDPTHSGLAAMNPSVARKIVETICRDDYARQILRSVALFEQLPGRELWVEFTRPEHDRIDWDVLARSVAITLDHQSQESTDCRWLKVLFLLLKGQLHPAPPEEGGELGREVSEYPNFGDMRKVRPLIRATEGAMSLAQSAGSSWPEQFWSKSLRETGCLPLNRMAAPPTKSLTSVEVLDEALAELVSHADRTQTTTAVDARHDLIFGTALYSVSILRELSTTGAGRTILGRMGLRTILESYITLSYLVSKDSNELWKSFRVYGAGQAKLAFLKIDECEPKPSYVAGETLRGLANEDTWQEFLNIDVGHWTKSNLRALSIGANAKDAYDRFYPWTSAYTHAHWAALRDSVFDVCGNPLHRLHRIPRDSARALDDVVSDACKLVDRILAIVDKCYPGLTARVSLNAAIAGELAAAPSDSALAPRDNQAS